MILTPAQQKVFGKSLASCNDVRPTLEWLQAIAGNAPQFKDQIEQLVTQHQYLQTLCETALEADRAIGN